MNEEETNASEKSIICPACGGENPADTVFCHNPECRKALGEFAYIEEEFATVRRWHERVAEKVSEFVGKPHFVLFHGVWFIVWIAINSGILMVAKKFDDPPFNLLSFVLGLETIFITGFLLISQNRQSAHAAKLAELDYEVNVRTYRELRQIHAKLDRLISEKSEREG